MACSFAAEDFHLLPKHQLAWRSRFRLSHPSEIECWGDDGSARTIEAPSGRFDSVSAGANSTCALRESGEMVCWGSLKDPPPGKYRSVSVGNRHSCAVRESGGVICWTNVYYGAEDPSPGTYRSVSAGDDFTCAVRDSGEIACWGRDDHGQTNPPSGAYRSLSAGQEYACAVRESGEIDCWGDNEYGQTDAPPGSSVPASGVTEVDVEDHRAILHTGVSHVKEDYGGQGERELVGVAAQAGGRG